MKRKIIKINEGLCNGCGNCITDCAEGALKIIDGKAKIVKDSLCDGLGACMGGCPTGALTIEERDAAAFDEAEVHKHVCPGSKTQIIERPAISTQAIQSELSQWPVQLHLVNPEAPYFMNRELVVLSTCSPTASADVHWRFIRGRSIVVMCPKLDRTENYRDKLVEIIKANNIPKIIAVIMEVPCCKGLSLLVQEALHLAGNKTKFEERVISINGNIK